MISKFVVIFCCCVVIFSACQSNSINGMVDPSTVSKEGILSNEESDVLPENHANNENPFLSVKIGTQVWMVKNLSVDTFRNGDLIPEASSDIEWEIAGDQGLPAWCYYLNHSTLGAELGKLYNFHVIEDERGLAPNGWRIPTLEDWEVLKNFLGENHAHKIKSQSVWFNEGNGTNESGLSVLPGGMRYYDGQFMYYGEMAFFWSSSSVAVAHASLQYVSGNYGNDVRVFINSKARKAGGLSIRCIKDTDD